MLTMVEKNEFLENMESISNRIFENSNEGELFLKVLVNYIKKTSLNNLEVSQLNEFDEKNLEEMKRIFIQCLILMVDVAAEEESEFVPTYTTGQLAKYFGVSITTINNWINKGRFNVVSKAGANAQSRVSANAIWISRKGKIYPVSEIVKEWEEGQDANRNKQ